MGEEGTAMRMVLCETEESRRTYTLNSFGQTISSYEELCYIISGQYLYFLTEGIPEGMREWIEEELGLVLPAEEERSSWSILSVTGIILRFPSRECLSSRCARPIYIPL